MANAWLTDDVFKILESVHFTLANFLPVLVAIHIVAILVYKFCSKPLTWAMVTGIQKGLSQYQRLQFASQLRAFLVLVLATSVTMTIIAFSF